MLPGEVPLKLCFTWVTTYSDALSNGIKLSSACLPCVSHAWSHSCLQLFRFFGAISDFLFLDHFCDLDHFCNYCLSVYNMAANLVLNQMNVTLGTRSTKYNVVPTTQGHLRAWKLSVSRDTDHWSVITWDIYLCLVMETPKHTMHLLRWDHKQSTILTLKSVLIMHTKEWKLVINSWNCGRHRS